MELALVLGSQESQFIRKLVLNTGSQLQSKGHTFRYILGTE